MSTPSVRVTLVADGAPVTAHSNKEGDVFLRFGCDPHTAVCVVMDVMTRARIIDALRNVETVT